MINYEQIRTYFWYLFGVMGVVFFWTGIWDGLGYLPYLENPLISLAVGLVMVLISKKTMKTIANIGQNILPVGAVLRKVHKHPQKHEFQIKYKDKLKDKEVAVKAGKIKNFEKGFLIILEKGKEKFIPFHRITSILHKGKEHWKA